MAGRGGKARGRRRSTSFNTIATLMLLPIGGLLLYLSWHYVRTEWTPVPLSPAIQSRPMHRDATSQASVAAPRSSRVREHAASQLPDRTTEDHQKSEPPAGRGAGRRIVLILDDVGFARQPLDGAMRIDPNLNFAVLPNAGFASEYARRLHSGGFEILCHMPMEPLGYPGTSPGEHAILTSMSDAEIAATTRSNLSFVPYARGVNNHMGSRATSDRRVMADVLTAMPRGMYFIDSKTSESSIAGGIAREMNVRTASRNIFLDNVQSEDAIRRQLVQLTDLAETRGIAVGIGHIYPVTVKVLNEEAPQLRARGFRFLRASEAVN